jgi:hypothetical protein
VGYLEARGQRERPKAIPAGKRARREFSVTFAAGGRGVVAVETVEHAMAVVWRLPVVTEPDVMRVASAEMKDDYFYFPGGEWQGRRGPLDLADIGGGRARHGPRSA